MRIPYNAMVLGGLEHVLNFPLEGVVSRFFTLMFGERAGLWTNSGFECYELSQFY